MVCRGIGEHESNVLGQGFREERREYVVHAGSDTRDGAIGEDENGTISGNMLVNLGRNALFVELVLLNTMSMAYRGCEPSQ